MCLAGRQTRRAGRTRSLGIAVARSDPLETSRNADFRHASVLDGRGRLRRAEPRFLGEKSRLVSPHLLPTAPDAWRIFAMPYQFLTSSGEVRAFDGGLVFLGLIVQIIR